MLSFPAIVEAFYVASKRLGDSAPTFHRCSGDPVALAIRAAAAAGWRFAAPHLVVDQHGRAMGLRHASPQLALQSILEALEAAAVGRAYHAAQALAWMPARGAALAGAQPRGAESEGRGHAVR